MAANRWEIFCRVIDNLGDIGVCWRLSQNLAARGQQVRLWIDDPQALSWMAPQGSPGVEIKLWTTPFSTDDLVPGDILVEAFGCEIAPEFVAAYARKVTQTNQKTLWLNLEYLSAETFVERNHGLPSPVATNSGINLNKYFFYPGFTADTGGLLRESDLEARQARFDRVDWLRKLGVKVRNKRLVSLFCYEPQALDALLDNLAAAPHETLLLVTPGRATAAVKASLELKEKLSPGWNKRYALSVTYLPKLTQHEYDHLLWSCDLNFVRGEDSWVRSVWANQPLVWQVYPQHDNAHHAKLEAFLDLLKAPPSLRQFHYIWNGMPTHTATNLPELSLSEWRLPISLLRNNLIRQDDLVTQIIRFAEKNR